MMKTHICGVELHCSTPGTWEIGQITVKSSAASTGIGRLDRRDLFVPYA
jgi:hypothetical protein